MKLSAKSVIAISKNKEVVKIAKDISSQLKIKEKNRKAVRAEQTGT